MNISMTPLQHAISDCPAQFPLTWRENRESSIDKACGLTR